MRAPRLWLLLALVSSSGSACTHDWRHSADDAGRTAGDAPDAEAPALDSVDATARTGTGAVTSEAGVEAGASTTSDGGASLDAQPASDGQAPTTDAGALPTDAAILLDATSLVLDAAPVPSCPAVPTCPAAHPCVPNVGGTTCRGERADFPLPLRKAGQSAAAQQFVVQGATLIDTVTGLMWERLETGTNRTYAAADTYCEGLSLEGYSDFRVPARFEMATWLGSEVVPEVDGALVGTHYDFHHWTSSPDRRQAAQNWVINLDDGLIWTVPLSDMLPVVRCVRTHEQRYAGSNENRMSTSAAGVASDRATGLSWQQSVQNAQSDIAFGAADSYCAALELDGKSDWRLPSYLELLTSFDTSQAGPTTLISPLLGPTSDQDCYWSSTLSSVHAGQRYTAFVGGSGLSSDPTKVDATCAARCVRK